MARIPTIDLRQLAPGVAERSAALEQLRSTVATIGAFYLIGHGVEAEAADRLFSLSRRFFALPLAQRREIEMKNSLGSASRSGCPADRGANASRVSSRSKCR